jgi:hypothetical protein
MKRYGLRDDQFARIEGLLRGRPSHFGRNSDRGNQRYCERNLVERFFNFIKQFREIATRYEKTARNFLAGLHLVCAIAWLK